ncbi:putative mitochondrial carrier protein [Peziza echinospora]|nr:putative mitochondrial carrier protein [Peziza echinospora]
MPAITTSMPSPAASLGQPPSPPPPGPRHSPSYLSHFTSGLSSGAVSAFVLQPADLLKTRLQQQSTPQQRSTLTKTLKGILNGPSPIPTLWRGTVPSVIRTSVGSALYFSVLASIREQLASTSSALIKASNAAPRHNHSSALVQLSPTANLISGAFTRATVGFIMMPVTILKVRFESDMYPQYKSMLSASTSILRTEGVAGFFRGWGATAVRDAPNAGLYLFFYEAGKKYLSPLFLNPSGTQDLATSTWINMVSSGLAGALATAVTNPFDTLKTRLQVSPGAYTNMWTALAKILKEEGPRRLFDGLGLRMGRKAISSSVVWTGYEFFIGRDWSGKMKKADT